MRTKLIPLLAVAVVFAVPATAQAAYSSTESGGDAVIVGDPGASDDTITLTVSGANLAHTPLMPGANSAIDFDTSVAGDQVVPNSGANNVQVLTQGGNDFVGIGAPGNPASNLDPTVIILDGTANDTMQVDNSTDATPRSYTVGSGNLTGHGGGGIAYLALGAMNVFAGGGPDEFDFSPSAPPSSAVFAGAGADFFLIPNGATINGAANVLDGEAGVDEINYVGWTTAVTIGPPGAAPDYPATATGLNQIASIEDFVGGPQSDTLNGNPEANEITSGAGDDAVVGDASNDEIDSGNGADAVGGRGGDDAIDTGSGDDSVSGDDGADVIDSGEGADAITGDAGEDGIESGAGDDAIDGGSGGDGIEAGPGNDDLVGGPDDDFLDGGTGTDFVSYVGVPGPVSANLGGRASDDGFGAIDQYAPGTLEDLAGGPQADTLIGDGAPNTIRGNLGADAIFGGASNDLLLAEDGETDAYLDCGTGEADVLNRDPATIDPDSIVTDCEIVSPPLSGPVPPSNEFEIGKPEKNTKNGSAKLPISVPGAGELRMTGKGVEGVTKAAAGEGTVNLKIKPKGKVEKKLRSKGKATVTVDITFTPTGGDSNAKSTQVKLKEK